MASTVCERPGFTVPAAQERAVASNLLRLSGDEADLGLKLGLSHHLSAYGLLGYGLSSSATGMDAITLAGRRRRLTTCHRLLPLS
ncbi:AraC family transcriptional regulator ligand-binding domain-containing protein [Burkholderia stagnalis]|uniref:AraC family transcriptional regulator ligand-binding domain-containing protein n=1 Tax=Burkholderia stagnalis TaxID=1503054 RepID=UPI0009C06C7E|nr:AraC family transcriptional regulator ligand-binding domain-containing protein [Burkholderia stagnalis]